MEETIYFTQNTDAEQSAKLKELEVDVIEELALEEVNTTCGDYNL